MVLKIEPYTKKQFWRTFGLKDIESDSSSDTEVESLKETKKSETVMNLEVSDSQQLKSILAKSYLNWFHFVHKILGDKERSAAEEKMFQKWFFFVCDVA